MQKGTLYLIPSALGGSETDCIIPEGVKKIISTLEFFIVENEKSARHFLKCLNAGIIQQNLKMLVIDKHSENNSYDEYLKPLRNGKDAGLLSEAGAPAIADPGAEIIRLAHKENVRVVPLTGPSSVFLALMASGLNGQRFCFHGYLPVKSAERREALRQLERESLKKKQTQIFIETPYRNMPLFDDIISACQPETLLCIAVDITLKTEMIATKNISKWKSNVPDLNKRPAVFLLES